MNRNPRSLIWFSMAVVLLVALFLYAGSVDRENPVVLLLLVIGAGLFAALGWKSRLRM